MAAGGQTYLTGLHSLDGNIKSWQICFHGQHSETLAHTCHKGLAAQTLRSSYGCILSAS